MLKFVITTDNDRKETAKIQARRRYEEDRKKRIFNGKQRLFGLDFDGLTQQIVEKETKRQLEAAKERVYVEQTQRRTNLLRAQELEQEKLRKTQAAELNYYRCRFQKKDMAREYDLNDPKLRMVAARTSDDDPRLGISSMQVFAGEDLHFTERRKAQRNQQRSWLEQQMKEKKQAEEDRNKADSIMMKSLKDRDRRLIDMSAAERENQSKIEESILRYNQVLAAEKRAKDQSEKRNTQEDNLAEIYNMLSSDMLTENPDVAQSKVHLNKKIAYLYRGMTPEEALIFRKEQYRQLEQNRKKKDEDKMKEKLWEQQALNMDHELTLKHREIQRTNKNLLEEMYKSNIRLAEEQKARRAYLDKHVYRNQTTDEFWDQFNKGTR